MMVMAPGAVRRGEERLDRFFLSGCVTHHFSAFADALVRLDV